MGFFDKLKGELVDIVEWIDNSDDTMVYRFERYQNEIKNGAKLTVRENQIAVFMNEGKTADIFQPGMYTLETQNLPILSTMRGWKYGFNSPFKAEVYFLNTRVFTNRTWGTPGGSSETEGGVYFKDAEIGRIRIKAFGNYSIKIVDPKAFMTIVGTDGHYTTEELDAEIRATALQNFIDALGEAKIPLFELNSNYIETSKIIQKKLNEDGFKAIGLECVKFQITSVSLPEKVNKMLDASTGNTLMGDPNAIYKMGTIDALNNAASNENGAMNGFFGMGMMNNMNPFQQQQQQMFNQQQNQNFQQNPPPMPPPLSAYFVAVNGAQSGPFDLNTLGQMAKQGSFNKDSVVWKQGMSAWTAAGQIPELAAIFNNVPPPIPK